MRISDWSSDVCSSDLFHEIGEHGSTMVCRNAFGMKLNALNGQAGMAEAHDHRIIAGGVDDEFRRNVLHHKTMVASGGKGGGETFKKPGPVMAYGRGLSMHQPPAHDFPAEMLSNRLMAQANAQQRLSRVSASGDKVKRNPRFVGCAWSR